MSLGKLWETVKDREVWRAAFHEVTKNGAWLSNWTTTTKIFYIFCKVNLFQIKLLTIFPKSSSLLFVFIPVRVLVVLLVLSRFQSCQTRCNPMDYSPPGPQAPLSMGFSRQGHWSGVPSPSPGDLPDPGIESWSPALQADSLPTELQGKPSTEER